MKNHPASSTRRFHLRSALIPAIVLVLALFAGLPMLMGVRSIDWQHAAVQVRVSGVDRPEELEGMKEAMRQMGGYRRGTLAQTSLAEEGSYRMQIEFRASSMTDATVRLLEWKKQFAPPIQMELEKVLYHTLHLHRPERGAVVLGTSRQISSSSSAEDSKDKGERNLAH